MRQKLTKAGPLIQTSRNRKSSKPQLQLQQLKAEKARRSLKEFVKQAWPILEPGTPFAHGIHVDAICSHLQAVTDGRI